ncbi:MAG TPA: CmcI family methyltransferase, partial [Acidimicrobiales bacterium]|nr:CmcI family methyltransferase [Acidimicrobiales bacterium]
MTGLSALERIRPPLRRLAQRRTRLIARAYQRTLGGPVDRLYHYGLIVRTGNFGGTAWLGVPIWQNVLDLWTIQETIAEIKPALLIETGTHKGGSALFYAHLMDMMGTGRVLTIDIVDLREQHHDRVRFLHGSSTDPAIVEQVRQEVADAEGPVMVILDGNHARDHVAEELELYAPMVTVGSLLLSQDGVIDVFRLFRDSRPGPLPANVAFLAGHPEFA